MTRTLNVMFIDDELPVLDGIRRALNKTVKDRWELSFFQDGSSALREIEERQPDVLVTDMKMPEMDGKLLLKIVHARFPSIRTYLLSGQCSEQEAEEVAHSTAHLLAKPFNSETLLRTLQPVDTAKVMALTARLEVSAQPTLPETPPHPMAKDIENEDDDPVYSRDYDLQFFVPKAVLDVTDPPIEN
jgi:DNA-binding NtrC family response regulator